MNNQICVIEDCKDLNYWMMSHENEGLLWHSSLVIMDDGTIVKNRYDSEYIRKIINYLQKCLDKDA